MLGQFPDAGPLQFLKASPLRFRVVRVSRPLAYQEIRFISTVGMHGFASFLAPDTLDDTLYNTLRVQVSISNFPTSSSLDFTRTIIPGAAADVVTLSFIPDEATFLSNLALLSINLGSTTKTATLMTQHLTNRYGVPITAIQTFTLSNVLVEPLGSSKSIRAWQHLMVDHLATLRTAVEAQQAIDIAARHYTLEDTWDRDWYIGDTGTHYGEVGAQVAGLAKQGFNADPPPLTGYNILQVDKGPLNAEGNRTFLDVLGVEGAMYYPGATTANRLVLWAYDTAGDDNARMASLLPSYHAPDLVYLVEERLSCSQVRHRIRPSVSVRMSRRPLLAGGSGTAGFSPDIYDGPSAPSGGAPILGSRVQFDTVCPAVSIPDFWNTTKPDDYLIQQVYGPNAATNVNGFVIPL